MSIGTFREWLREGELNEAKITSTQVKKILDIIKKELKSKKMIISDVENNIWTVNFDNIGLVFMNRNSNISDIIGLLKDTKIYQLPSNIKNLKDLYIYIKTSSNFNNIKGEVDSIKDLKNHNSITLDVFIKDKEEIKKIIEKYNFSEDFWIYDIPSVILEWCKINDTYFTKDDKIVVEYHYKSSSLKYRNDYITISVNGDTISTFKFSDGESGIYHFENEFKQILTNNV